ncbi:CAAX prenyl protease 1 homolog [Chlamydiales bacterium SCGC AB-751-O23]|jgi:STE24 endopeptidase|nr:CAAX prenyl protease 1 homolog [Chlamydiales bacterium SCGC AB-751-O23]
MNLYLIVIIALLLARFAFSSLVDSLNVNNLSHDLPEEMKEYYDAEKYQKSQSYLVTQTRYALVEESFTLITTLAFILLGGFNFIDQFARSFQLSTIYTGTIFLLTLSLVNLVINLPFSLYHTFVLEQKFGFNQTTIKTYIGDFFKQGLLFCLLALPIFASITYFFDSFGSNAWWQSFLFIVAFQVTLMYLSPTLIMPLFNKFTPLEDGELKQAIFDYAEKEDFPLKEIYTMDGSKRSAKSNAFFTGFGKSKRVVLYDTLIEKHSTEELVAVIAHEMGHYKKRHIPKLMFTSFAQLGFMFFLLSFFIKNPDLFKAFKMQDTSTYASLIFFAFLYSPISFIISIFSNFFLRKYEFEADAFSFKSYRRPGALITALKKLSVHNLSNLTPHPLKVFIEYSHPPVLQRIEALKKLETAS